MRLKLKSFVGIFGFRSLCKLDPEERGAWQPNTHARAKVTRGKVGKTTKMWCRKCVQLFDDFLFERVVKSS